MRCDEILPNDEEGFHGASASLTGSESHKLHERILESTDMTRYRDILLKSTKHWTSVGLLSFKRATLIPISTLAGVRRKYSTGSQVNLMRELTL